MATRKIEVAITGDASSLERAFRRSGSAADSFGHKLSRGVGKGLLAFGAGAAGAAVIVGGVFAKAVKDGVKANIEHEAALKQTQAALKSTKGAAGVTAKGITGLADSLEKLTGTDDLAIQKGENLLLTFTGIRNAAGKNNDIFDQTVKVMNDMSVALGQDTKASAIQLGKALNDPVRGVTALKKVGVSFTEDQQKQIKALQESGNVMGAQKLILRELNKEFGGSGVAAGKSFAGQVKITQAYLEEFEQQLAGPFMGVLNQALKGLVTILRNPEVQAGLKAFATGLANAIGSAITWLQQNWPTIKTILSSVWEWYRTYIQSVVVPIVQGLITGIGALIDFVRNHMPEIRAAAQATFGWIQTNIVPTVRTVANTVAAIVRGMATVWREHGEDIKRIVAPVFNTLKVVIVGALSIIKSSIEFYMALFRGDFDKAFSALGSIVSTSMNMVKTVLLTQFNVLKAIAGIAAREVVDWIGDRLGELKAKVAQKFNQAKTALVEAKDAMLTAAASIGRRIVDGIINGLGGLYSRVKAKLESDLKSVIDKLNPFSPVEHGGVIIATRLTNGIVSGLEKTRASVAKGLTATVRQAVDSARSNLSGLTGGLAGMLGTAFAANARSTGSLTGGKTLAQIRGEQARVAREREKARLEDAVANAASDEERAQAQQDLNDWLIEDEARQLEESIQQQQDAYDTNIKNLTASFNAGAISAQQFRDQLNAMIGGETGAELGAAFASEFDQQLKAIADQVRELIGFTGATAGTGATSPGQTSYEEKLAAWQKKHDAKKAALEKAAKAADSPGKGKITAAEQDEINAALAKWVANNPRPKKLAGGGVLTRAVIAGEAGPEAVLPLSNGRAQMMLASALARADRVNNGGGGTVINVTVNGNELSARDFAKKLQPELNRLVGMGAV